MLTDKQTDKQTNGTENITSFDFVGGGNKKAQNAKPQTATAITKTKILVLPQDKKHNILKNKKAQNANPQTATAITKTN